MPVPVSGLEEGQKTDTDTDTGAGVTPPLVPTFFGGGPRVGERVTIYRNGMGIAVYDHCPIK